MFFLYLVYKLYIEISIRARSWPGPDLARTLWPGAAEVQVQGQAHCEPNLGVQVQVQKICSGPGPDRTLDSLTVRLNNILLIAA